MDHSHYLPRPALQALIDALRDNGYRVIGPQVRDAAVQYLELGDAEQLPTGWTDEQSAGHYRLQRTDTPRAFAWAASPQLLKPLLFGSRDVLWRVERNADGRLEFLDATQTDPPLAVIGVRACDLAALALQDRHFLEHARDPLYAARRERLFTVAVDCTAPADTCFCASTGDGPANETGYDILLRELDDGFIVTAGSERGRHVVEGLPTTRASDTQCAQAKHETDKAAQTQSRALPPGHLEANLFAHLDAPRWDEVGARCLACGNCTSVCPTCFCHAEQDVPTLAGDSSEHVREWDSCFTSGHAYLHGFQVRPTNTQRYRQWMTHKLGSWHSQYGRSGCVGCGRCISWCPAGIDITEEANAVCGGAA